MNLILLHDDDFDGESQSEKKHVRLTGRRRQHVLQIHRASVGDQLVVGLEGDRVGRGRITRLDDVVLELDVELGEAPPPKLGATLALALPRPPVLARVVSAATALGVDHIALFHTRRVEKTYWDSSAAKRDNLIEAMRLGLEQARDTVLPGLSVHRRFRPFVAEELPILCEGRTAWIAHPGSPKACPARIEAPAVVAIGPEGGFLEHEIETLVGAGLEPVRLGRRVFIVQSQ